MKNADKEAAFVIACKKNGVAIMENQLHSPRIVRYNPRNNSVSFVRRGKPHLTNRKVNKRVKIR